MCLEMAVKMEEVFRKGSISLFYLILQGETFLRRNIQIIQERNKNEHILRECKVINFKAIRLVSKWNIVKDQEGHKHDGYIPVRYGHCF